MHLRKVLTNKHSKFGYKRERGRKIEKKRDNIYVHNMLK